MIRKAFRWLLYLDLFEDMERKLHEMEVVRDAYRDNARSLAEETCVPKNDRLAAFADRHPARR